MHLGSLARAVTVYFYKKVYEATNKFLQTELLNPTALRVGFILCSFILLYVKIMLMKD